MRFLWERYFPWFFLADLVIWSAIVAGVLWWVLR